MGPRYATDPDYADKLLTLIREEGLTRFDPGMPSTSAP
jgi:flagellum-specific peptidoglycan hydrolase FlgJ